MINSKIGGILKKSIVRRLATGVVTLVMVLGSGTLPAQAAGSSAVGDSCTSAEVHKGDCVTAVVSAGEDPLLVGVAQQLQMGVPLPAIEKFVERRGSRHVDPGQAKIQGLVATYKDALTPDEKQKALRVYTQGPARNAGGVGAVYGSSLYVKDTVTYTYCSSSTGICRPSGSVSVEFRMTIVGNLKFALSGDIDVVSGSPVLISGVGCSTYHDAAMNLDTVVHAWGNCKKAKTSNEVMYRQILVENWSGGTLGETYHPTYALSFQNFATRFYKAWDGREYKIAANGVTTWS
ncbi:hypothetical protein [Paenarthrobacter sp. NCHU4564]|uniref:hypothetical protein n=1 Tax=Paenarthrobacter sp. NCHU4564 TaxID=3451353 RepID=UPI003F996467